MEHFDREPPGILTEAYVKDVIDLETYERFVGLYLEGKAVALPAAVMDLARRPPTDAPGSVIYYWPLL